MSDYREKHFFGTPAPAWAEQELAVGDRICAALGLSRTEGGSLPVAKILACITNLQEERNYAQDAATAEAKLADERHARQRDAEAALGFLRCHPQSVRAQEYADKVLAKTQHPAEHWFAASVVVLANILQQMGWKLAPLEPTPEMRDFGLVANRTSEGDVFGAAPAYRAMIAETPPFPLEEFDLPFIPRSPQDMIDFIGSHYNSMTFADEQENPLPLDRVRYGLTVHDLLSAFRWAGFYDVKLPAPNRAALRERESPPPSDKQGECP